MDRDEQKQPDEEMKPDREAIESELSDADLEGVTGGSHGGGGNSGGGGGGNTIQPVPPTPI